MRLLPVEQRRCSQTRCGSNSTGALKHVFRNACVVTIACLLPISVRCTEPEELGMHSNATNIAYDLKDVPDDPRYEQLLSLLKCSLTCSDACRTSASLLPKPCERNAFRPLRREGFEQTWDELSRRLLAFGRCENNWCAVGGCDPGIPSAWCIPGPQIKYEQYPKCGRCYDHPVSSMHKRTPAFDRAWFFINAPPNSYVIIAL